MLLLEVTIIFTPRENQPFLWGVKSGMNFIIVVVADSTIMKRQKKYDEQPQSGPSHKIKSEFLLTIHFRGLKRGEIV